MSTPASAEPLSAPDSEQVCDFLTSHPEFFTDHPELLGQLRLAHASGRAVSLIERQVQVLREQNQSLKKRLLDLVDVARDNDRLNERMHQLTLDLVRATSLQALHDSLDHHLRNEFNADAMALHLPQLDAALARETGARSLSIDAALKSLLPLPLNDTKPQCGRLKQEQVEFLFGDQAAAIESSAVIPLGDNGQHGLLAIGSREVNRFNPCMGTLFLTHLGELVARLLVAHRGQPGLRS
jgi:uncharacterized protein YigA (DUF484 family)